MSGTAIALIIGVFLAMDAIILVLVCRSVAHTFDAFDRYPPLPSGPGAIRRNFQSISVGLVNLGFCAHLAVDATHLHFVPAAMGRFFRARAFSVPLEEVQIAKPGGRLGGVATIARESVRLPRWCMEEIAAAQSGMQ